MEIKAPLEIDYDNDSIDDIVKKIEMSIEQHPSFLKVKKKYLPRLRPYSSES